MSEYASNKSPCSSKNTVRHYNMPQNQQGVALIAVLLVLLLITLIGTVAIRQSKTDLQLSTSAQVDKVLFQANDAAFMKVEREDRILGARKGSVDTLKGYMSSPQRDNHEVNFCVRPRGTRLFSVLEISERNEDGNLIRTSGNGYCDPSDNKDYVSEGRVLTQMTFVKRVQTDTSPFSDRVVGTESNEITENGGNGTSRSLCTTFTGYATSVLPSFSNSPLVKGNSTGTDSIAGCLKQPRTGNNNVDTCLANLDVPFSTHVQVFRNQPVGLECISDN